MCTPISRTGISFSTEGQVCNMGLSCVVQPLFRTVLTIAQLPLCRSFPRLLSFGSAIPAPMHQIPVIHTGRTWRSADHTRALQACCGDLLTNS
jgi:hypothetical protein